MTATATRTPSDANGILRQHATPRGSRWHLTGGTRVLVTPADLAAAEPRVRCWYTGQIARFGAFHVQLAAWFPDEGDDGAWLATVIQ